MVVQEVVKCVEDGAQSKKWEMSSPTFITDLFQ